MARPLNHNYYVQHAPEKLVDAWRDAYATQDVHTIQEFIGTNPEFPPEARVQTLVNTALPEFLLEVVLNPRHGLQSCTYTLGMGQRSATVGSFDTSEYLMTVSAMMNYLAKLVQFMRQPMRTRSRTLPSCERSWARLTDRLPRLWRLLWAGRHVLLQNKGSGDSCIRAATIHLLSSCYDRSAPSTSLRSATSPSSVEANLMMYCWIQSDGMKPVYVNTVLRSIYSYFYSDRDGHVFDAETFHNMLPDLVRQALAGESTNLLPILMKTAASQICNRDIAAPATWFISVMLESITGRIPESLTTQAINDLYSCIIASSYRRLCSPTASSMDGKSCEYSLFVLQNMDKANPDLFIHLLLVTRCSLLPIVAHLYVLYMPRAAPMEDREAYDIMHYSSYILDLYGQCMVDFTKHYGHLGRPHQLAVEEAIRYTRKTWLQTLDALRAKAIDTPKTRKFEKMAIDTWIEHGKDFSLFETEERARLAEGDGEDETEETQERPEKPCNWSECLCAVHAAAHYMRRCKGCRNTYYCSKECQKRDWKGGHRDICTRLYIRR